MKANTEATTTRRRRKQLIDNFEATVRALDDFRALHPEVLAELEGRAKDYNAAVTALEKHLRDNPERVHLGPFKTHFKTKTPPTIDFDLLRAECPEVLLGEGVITRINVKAAGAAAIGAGKADELQRAIADEDVMAMSKPKAMNIGWSRM